MRLDSAIITLAALLSFAHAGTITSTSSSTTAASCSPTPKNPPPPPLICNGHGTVKRPSPLAGYPKQVAQVNDCRDMCLADTTCISYGYTGTTCTLYNKAIKASGYRKSNNNISFWNRNCFGPHCTCSGNLPDLCGTNCVDTDDDPKNCGRCGTVCDGGENGGAFCNGGNCLCNSGRTYCPNNGGCVQTNGNDNSNCGSCGATAVNTCCGGQDIDTTSNAKHCGGCNSPCGQGETCSGSQCMCATSSSMNYDSDPDNCGACGKACALLEDCNEGSCYSPSPVCGAFG